MDHNTLFIPIASPPTPVPSPSPKALHPVFPLSRQHFASLSQSNSALRRRYLAAILAECSPSELLFVSTTIAPLLKRDFLRSLPPEIALYILNFIHEPKTLARASQVSKHWRRLLADESLWKTMCDRFCFHVAAQDPPAPTFHYRRATDNDRLQYLDNKPPDLATLSNDPLLEWSVPPRKPSDTRSVFSRSRIESIIQPKSYREQFRLSYATMMNWRSGGHLLRAHRLPTAQTDVAVITSVALDAEWVVVGLANSKIHIFSAKTGVLTRTLVGHELGVWAVNLVSRGGFWGTPDDTKTSARSQSAGASVDSGRRRWRSADEDGEPAAGVARLSTQDDADAEGLEHSVPHSLRYTLGLTKPRVRRRDFACDVGGGVGKRSDPAGASEGWGQPHALVVSGGCDKTLRVWDVKSGYCIYALSGHTSTIRCVKVLHNRPIAVSGSRDASLRVWNVQRGRLLRVLVGHSHSVRCLDVCGNRVVSGSYDTTCRVWNVDTGECLHVLQGHMHQIYSVAFDGVRIASGGLDTTVRVWDAATGTCLALLQGHSALVCQLQLSPTMLATGGSDGRVITFCLRTFCALHRIDAHESSVTSLQLDSRFLVTGGNDGRVRLFETDSGKYVRELSERSESVWKVVHREDVCAIMCKRAGKTVMEIWSYGADEDTV